MQKSVPYYARWIETARYEAPSRVYHDVHDDW